MPAPVVAAAAGTAAAGTAATGTAAVGTTAAGAAATGTAATAGTAAVGTAGTAARVGATLTRTAGNLGTRARNVVGTQNFSNVATRIKSNPNAQKMINKATSSKTFQEAKGTVEGLKQGNVRSYARTLNTANDFYHNVQSNRGDSEHLNEEYDEAEVHNEDEKKKKNKLIGCLFGGCTSGCGCIIFPIVMVIFVIAYLLGVVQIADGAEMGGSSSVVGGNGYLQWAIDVANDDSHGYDQGNRSGPDYDCSSLVWFSLVEGAGFDKSEMGGYPFSTYTQASILKKNGFKQYTYTGEANLKPGDILLRDGHTGIYVGDSQTVEAHINEFGRIVGGQKGDQTGNEISVARNGGNWSSYFRLEG